MSTIDLASGIDKIIKEFKLPVSFSRLIEDEAARLQGEIPQEEIQSRIDLRDEIIVTIDGETAKDFDDAVSVKRLTNGYLLKVSIADVSYYVRQDTALDREAFRRGTSTYFPDRVLPMLPERLSNHLCSLVPLQDRLTFTAEMEFDTGGRRVSSRFYRSIIRSLARLTYTQVRQALVDRDPDICEKLGPVTRELETMEELADLIQEVRCARGSLDFDLPEPFIELDLEEGKIDRIVKAERNKAHRLIEEFMIAANEAVAEFVTEKNVPMVYRVHDRPDMEKVQDLGVLLNNLGHPVKLGRDVRPGGFASVINKVRGEPEERLINTVLLRTMKRAIYDTRNRGHFGLASACYTHFTSPIRRYPDLMVHRILASVLSSPKSKTSKTWPLAPLKQACQHSSETERNSMKAEWASRDLAAAIFMSQYIGETFEGIISNVTKFGFFVELRDFFVEGLVPLRKLKDDYYIYYEKNHKIVGKRQKRKFQIGNPVSIRVAGVNWEKRWVDFEVDFKKTNHFK